MELLEIDLARVRDYTGVQVPTDLEIYVLAEAETYWQEVALRVLRRRLADLNTGDGIASVSLSGELSVTFTRADIPTIRAAINRLEADLLIITGEASGTVVGRLSRSDRGR